MAFVVKGRSAGWPLLGLTALLFCASLAHANGHKAIGKAEDVVTNFGGSAVEKIQSWLSQIEVATGVAKDGLLTSSRDVEKPKPPPEAQLASKLVSAVGLALEKFYAEKVSLRKSTSCADAIGNVTESLLSKVNGEVDDICKEGTEFKTFCSFYEDLRTITGVALVSKLEINPISVALTRATLEVPCSTSDEETAMLNKHFRKLKKAAKVHWRREGGNARLREALATADSNGISECKDCLKTGFHIYAEFVLKKIDFVCSTTMEPSIKFACKFAKDHPYLTQIALVYKLKPWEKVIQSCVLVGQCRPPSADAQSGKDLNFLPQYRPFHTKDLHDMFHASFHVHGHQYHHKNVSEAAPLSRLWSFLPAFFFGKQASNVGSKLEAIPVDAGAKPAGPFMKSKCHKHKHGIYRQGRDGEHKNREAGHHHKRAADSVDARLVPPMRSYDSTSRRVARSLRWDGPGPLKPRGNAATSQGLHHKKRDLAGYRVHTRKGGVWGLEMKRVGGGDLIGRTEKMKKFRHKDTPMGKGMRHHSQKRVFEGEAGSGTGGVLKMERKLREGHGGRSVERHSGRDRAHSVDSEDHKSHHHYHRHWNGKNGENYKRTGGASVEEDEAAAEPTKTAAHSTHITLPRRVLHEASAHHGDGHHKHHAEKIGGEDVATVEVYEVQEEGEKSKGHRHSRHPHLRHHFASQLSMAGGEKKMEEGGETSHEDVHHHHHHKMNKGVRGGKDGHEGHHFHGVRRHVAENEDETEDKWYHHGRHHGFKHHARKQWGRWIQKGFGGWGHGHMSTRDDSLQLANGPMTWLGANLDVTDGPISELALLGEKKVGEAGKEAAEVVKNGYVGVVDEASVRKSMAAPEVEVVFADANGVWPDASTAAASSKEDPTVATTTVYWNGAEGGETVPEVTMAAVSQEESIMAAVSQEAGEDDEADEAEVVSVGDHVFEGEDDEEDEEGEAGEIDEGEAASVEDDDGEDEAEGGDDVSTSAVMASVAAVRD